MYPAPARAASAWRDLVELMQRLGTGGTDWPSQFDLVRQWYQPLLEQRYAAGFRAVLARPERTVLVVAHSLPIRYVLNAAAGGLPAPAMEQVPYAEALPLSAAELKQAVERLEAWTLAPAWAS